MKDRYHRRALWLFGLLAAYIVLQFVWWGVLLVRRDREVARLTSELHALGAATSIQDTSRGMRMILGEGAVFLLLLLVLLFLVYRTLHRELRLAGAQRNFLLAVTHELRTPIAAIKLQLQTLERPELIEEQRADLRGQALAEADRLALLTDKVLLATRAEEGLIDLDIKQHDICAMMRGWIDRACRQIAPDHNVVLRTPGQLLARTDEHALRSIAENLLENAAKYAPKHSTITVDLIAGRDGWRLSVSDEGPGIPPDEREQVFVKFHRGGREETRRTKGTGLGLYIVRRLVQRLGGAIRILDASPHGAIFEASFPLY